MDWAGRGVLIAGGAGGMGLAAAELFLARGGRVMLADIDSARLASAAVKLGRGVLIHEADIRAPQSCAAMVAAAHSAFGRLDLLVNAAGLWVEGESASMEEADWDRVMDVNLKGAFFAIRHALPHLIASGGQIINIASDAGLMGNSGAAIYCASKGGLVLLTKALALELAPKGVRVNAICPSDVDTPMLAAQAARYGGGAPHAYLDRLKALYPQGARTRFVRAEEIARFILAVAEIEAITGAALPIDFATTAGK